MVKITENENLNGNEKPKSGLDIMLDNLVFAEMCEKSLMEFFRGKLMLLERDLLFIMENELTRQKAKYADAPKAVSKFLEHVLIESLCSALSSANASARFQFLNEVSTKEAPDAFTEWLKARGLKFETRIQRMDVRKNE